MALEPVNAEEPEVIMSREDKLEDAVKKFQETAQSMLQAFLFIEENLKQAAQICMDLAELLEEDKPKPNPNQPSIFEGDNSAN